MSNALLRSNSSKQGLKNLMNSESPRAEGQQIPAGIQSGADITPKAGANRYTSHINCLTSCIRQTVTHFQAELQGFSANSTPSSPKTFLSLLSPRIVNSKDSPMWGGGFGGQRSALCFEAASISEFLTDTQLFPGLSPPLTSSHLLPIISSPFVPPSAYRKDNETNGGRGGSINTQMFLHLTHTLSEGVSVPLTAQRSVEDAEELERERRRRARESYCWTDGGSMPGETSPEDGMPAEESMYDGALKPNSSPSLEEDEGFSDWTQRRERRRQQRLQELSGEKKGSEDLLHVQGVPEPRGETEQRRRDQRGSDDHQEPEDEEIHQQQIWRGGVAADQELTELKMKREERRRVREEEERRREEEEHQKLAHEEES
ncbi:hypothetical protein KUCAC02_017064 [Chaenocephalus aceratus]|nr:hypothetical protein KUCAC02_017064 [Chaenocephalus aceratus]